MIICETFICMYNPKKCGLSFWGSFLGKDWAFTNEQSQTSVQFRGWTSSSQCLQRWAAEVHQRTGADKRWPGKSQEVWNHRQGSSLTQWKIIRYQLHCIVLLYVMLVGN